MSIRFDDKVVIVTGAGGGLGKEHAIEFAKRGAKVVVNDLGSSVDGSGASDSANEVVENIKSTGGEAIANGASVTDLNAVKEMVNEAMEKWGRVDVLVNNAGILRDKSFHKMSIEDFNLVMSVHFEGTLNCTHTVFPIMREQNYGRVIFTSSSSGVFGNFGQSNYGSAKMAMIGLMNTLKIEGQKYNIHSNSITPVAYTRMTDSLLPDEVGESLQPEFVTPAVIYLSSLEAPNGVIVSAGAGVYSRIFIHETDGVSLGMGDEMTPEKEDDSETKFTIEQGDYDEFFKSAMKKFGIKSPADLDDDEKKKFFNYVDANYKAEKETD